MDITVLIQIGITTGAVIVTYYAAIRGAERGSRLNELAMIDREVRERVEEQKRQKHQIKAMRLLLALEIRQNLIDLDWLLKSMADFLGEERELYYLPGRAEQGSETQEWLEARQRFMALYIPDWAHRCWYGQQSSYLVTVALKQLEIRQLSRHHMLLDRLTKITNTLTEKLTKSNWKPNGERIAPTAFPPLEDDALRLWNEFVSVVADTLKLGNPFTEDLKEAGVKDLEVEDVDALTAPTVNSQLPEQPRHPQIEAGSTAGVVESAGEPKAHVT